jgi:hypothetical protein
VTPGDSERRKNPPQLVLELARAALAAVAVMKRERIEMPRAREVSGPEIFRCACIDDYHAGVVAPFTKPSRIDEEIRF